MCPNERYETSLRAVSTSNHCTSTIPSSVATLNSRTCSLALNKYTCSVFNLGWRSGVLREKVISAIHKEVTKAPSKKLENVKLKAFNSFLSNALT